MLNNNYLFSQSNRKYFFRVNPTEGSNDVFWVANGFHLKWKKRERKTGKKMNISSVEKEKYWSPGHELFKPNKIMQYIIMR